MTADEAPTMSSTRSLALSVVAASEVSTMTTPVYAARQVHAQMRARAAPDARC